jgi:hypothetical protein
MDPAPLPPTVEDLDRRMKILEARRDSPSLNDEEIKQLREDWKKVREHQGKPATGKSFIDWLFE